MFSQWTALISHSVYRSILTFADDHDDDDYDDDDDNNNNNDNNLFTCLAWGYLPVAPDKSTNNMKWKGRSNHPHDVTNKPTQTVSLEILNLEYVATTFSRNFGNQSPSDGGRGIPQPHGSTNLTSLGCTSLLTQQNIRSHGILSLHIKTHMRDTRLRPFTTVYCNTARVGLQI